MKQAVMPEPGMIVFEDAERAEPGPDDVVLEMKHIGVCGSDVHVFHGQHPFTGYPMIQGHECSARIHSVRKGGQVLVVAVVGMGIPLDAGIIQDREIAFKGTCMYKKEDFATAAGYLAEGRCLIDRLITHHFPFADYRAAYERLEKKNEPVMKVMIDL
ncbi:MAG: alcohol dehydrogenase catalytic domain-containing protein [Kiritimatiellae bacterium]|nr:alcohol dehydrogenase catalytic domain-containing protein [Kiritimatiellia bacterium]